MSDKIIWERVKEWDEIAYAFQTWWRNWFAIVTLPDVRGNWKIQVGNKNAWVDGLCSDYNDTDYETASAAMKRCETFMSETEAAPHENN